MSRLSVITLALATIVCPLAVFAEPLTVKTPEGQYKMYDRSLALIIGASTYKDTLDWPKLNMVSSEVDHVLKALKDQGFETTLIADPDGNTLSQSIKRFVTQRVSRDTRLLIYFAGHGWTKGDDKTGYIVPVDAPKDDDGDFLGKLVSMDEIKGWSHLASAKHILFVFDSCFSGSIFLTRSNTRPGELYVRDIDRRGIQFITSGSASEEVPDSSVFSDYFVAGISGDADYNKDGIVSASELGYYLRNVIIPKRQQTPQYGSDPDIDYRNGDEIFKPIQAGPQNSPTLRVEPPGQPGPRGAALRGIGEPSTSKGEVFKGLEVFYYEKISDQGLIKDALNKEGIPFVSTRATLPDALKVNALACGIDVPINALVELAATLIQAGIAIREIRQFARPDDKPRRLEVLSITDDTNLKKELASTPLSIEQISALTKCPRLLKNS